MSASFFPRRIVLHYSASDHGSAEEFRAWHRARGWSDIGYHYVIDNDPDGELQHGRSVLVAGAHAHGANADSIGICIVGDGDPPPTARQMLATVNLCAALCVVFGVSHTAIYGHRDFCSTDCPGDYIYSRLASIREGVRRRVVLST